MGLKPSRPVVAFSYAQQELEKQCGLDGSLLQRYFTKSCVELSQKRDEATDGNGDQQQLQELVSVEMFAMMVPFAKPFFELGELVSTRLFQVLGSSEGVALNYEQFICALYMFCCSTDNEKYRLLFNMFDLNGGGFIKKKEFRAMCLALVKGSSPTIPETFDNDFKGLEKLMTDAGMTLYDTNKDGKLSLDEWKKYAVEDANVCLCFEALKSPDSKNLIERIKSVS